MDFYPSRMRVRFVSLALVIFLLGESAAAQLADWSAVQNIAPGTPISVKTRVRILCVFEEATADTLDCAARRVNVVRTRSSIFTFKRTQIREVRLEHSDQSNAAIGAGVGGGVGAVIGASKANRTLTREGSALFLGSIGAIIGSGFGRDFPILHGQVVYKK